MAALTTSNVRLIAAWVEGEVYSKRRQVRVVEVYGGTWGGQTNTMPATAFGLRKIEEATPGYKRETQTAVSLVPNDTGDTLLVFKALDDSGTPADITMTDTPDGLYFTVKGY